MMPKSVLFVCLGNICRSPSAQALMMAKAQALGLPIYFDSAGTSGYHAGSPPDERAVYAGEQLGYKLSTLRARQINSSDFYNFDIILAMDTTNLANLRKIQPNDATAQLMMFDGVPVADPYYGDMADFVAMYAHLATAADHWLMLWQAINE